MLKKITIVILSVLLYTALTASVVSAQTNSTSTNSTQTNQTETQNQNNTVSIQSINPNGVPLQFSPYNVSTVILTYAEAVNYFVNVSSSDSNHYETQSPRGMTATLAGVGSYILRFNVFYSQMVDQPITLTVNGGDGRPTTFSLQSRNTGFTLDVIVTTSRQPTFPTKEEMGEYLLGQSKQILANMSLDFQARENWRDAAIISGTFVVIVLSVCIVILWRNAKRDIIERAKVERIGYGGNR